MADENNQNNNQDNNQQKSERTLRKEEKEQEELLKKLKEEEKEILLILQDANLEREKAGRLGQELLDRIRGVDKNLNVQLLKQEKLNLLDLKKLTELEAQIKSYERMQKTLDDQIAASGIITDAQKNQLINLQEMIVEAEKKKSLLEQAEVYEKNAKKGLMETLKLEKAINLVQMARLKPMAMGLNLITKALKMTIAMTIEYDKQRAELAKLTGGVEKYNDALAESVYQGRQFGLTAQESMKGTSALITGFTRINELSKEQTSQLGATVGALSQFGLNAEKTMDTASMVFQMSAQDSANLAKNLFEVGEALGPGMAQQINNQFGPSMAKLAAYTKDRAIKVFKGLAAQARATGLEISSLMTVMDQFDTFDGAAQAVGRLNSLLGGDYLNSVQMLYATEDQRLEIIKEGIRMSGRQFSDMARFEKKAFANALGVSSVAEAMQMLGTEQERFDELAAKADKAGLSVDEFRKRTLATKDIQQKFAAVMQNLGVVMQPFITVLHKILDVVVLAIPKNLNFAKSLGIVTVVVLSLTAALYGVSKAVMVFAPSTASLTAVSAGMAAAAPGILVFAKAMGVAALALIGIASALLIAASAYSVFSAARSGGTNEASAKFDSIKSLDSMVKNKASVQVLQEVKSVYTEIGKVSPFAAVNTSKAVEALHKVLVSAELKKAESKEQKVKIEVDVKNIANLESFIKKTVTKIAENVAHAKTNKTLTRTTR